MNFDEKTVERIKKLEREVERLRVKEKGGYWANWTPTLNTGGATLLSYAAAKYTQIGKTVFIYFSAGNAEVTGSGLIRISLPVLNKVYGQLFYATVYPVNGTYVTVQCRTISNGYLEIAKGMFAQPFSAETGIYINITGVLRGSMKPILDISFWQAPLKIDYDKLASQVDGVILRAAYGTSKDIHFDQHYAELSARGVPLGAYHYLIGSQSMSRQAVAFATILEGKQLKLGTWMDVEDIRSGTRLYRNQVLEYAALVPDSGIYTSRSRWHEIMGGAYLTDRKLWVAHYTTASQPLMPVGFSSYWLWQYSSTGRLAGYSGNLDMNRFGGSEQEWLAWIGEEEEPEPEPPVEVEDKLFDAKVTTTPPNRLKTRYTPNGAERPKADWLQSQAIVPVYETHSTGWWRVAPEAWSSATWMERVEDKLPEPQEPLFQARVYSWATPYVNVRAEPSLSAGKVGFKYPLAVTDVMSTMPDWYEVPEGWMMSRFLERLDYDPPVISTGKYYGALYWQRDPRWKDKPLGTSGTIGSYGCVMTAETNVLNQLGIKTNPVANNAWRTENNGYHNGNLIVWEKVTEQHPDIIWEGKTWNPTDAQIKQKIADGCPLVMLVDHNEGTPDLDEHWVNSIPSPIDDGAIWIHDPWDNSTIRLRDRYKKPIQQFSSYRRQA